MPTANLAIPYVSASQNQKEVTINGQADAIDAATQGQLPLTITGNTTLTGAQFVGAFIFRLNGTPAADFDLTVPATKRFFCVDNRSGKNVTVKRSGGGTTVTLATGKQSVLACDGSDVFQVGGGGGVDSLNSKTGAVSILAGTNMSIDNSVAGQITLNASGGGGTGVNYNAPFKGALLATSGTITGPTLPYIVAWDSESYDTSSFHDTVTNNTRITIPSGVTRVKMKASIQTDTTVSANSGIALSIRKNGSTTVGNHSFNSGGYTDVAIQCDTPVLNVVAGDYFEVRLNCNDASLNILSGGATYFSVEVVETDTAAGPPYDIHGEIGGVPAGSSKVFTRMRFPGPVQLPANCAGSVGRADVAATASTTFDLQKWDTSLSTWTTVGTMVYAAAGQVPTFTTSGGTPVNFVAGDALQVVGPASADATLADLDYTIRVLRGS